MIELLNAGSRLYYAAGQALRAGGDGGPETELEVPLDAHGQTARGVAAKSRVVRA